MVIVPAWRMAVGTCLLFVLSSLASLSGLGCASAPKFPRSASTGALDRVLGGAPEIVVTGHVADALKDPLWDPSKAAFFEDVDRLTRSPEAKRALASIDRVELYVRLSSPNRVLAIVRDVPSALTPEVLLSRDGSPAYKSERTLSSGVREYAPHPGDHGHVFVLPNHDWVVADDVSSPSVAALLASDGSSAAFPSPDLGLDRTAVAYLSASFFEHAAHVGWFSQPTPTEGVLLGVGNARDAEIHVKYATEAMAQKAEGENQKLLHSDLAGIKGATLARNGTVLSVSLPLPDMSHSLRGNLPLPREISTLPTTVPAPQVATPEPPNVPRFVPGPLPVVFACDGPIQRISDPPSSAPAPPRVGPSRPAKPGKPGKARAPVLPLADGPGQTSTRPRASEPDLDEPGAHTPAPVGPPPTAGQMTERAAVAKRLFDSERWNDAVRAFEPIVDGTTGDDEGNRQLAQYHRGVALFKLRRFPESAAIFREIAGSTMHLKHNETLLWLVQLSASNPDELRITDFAKYRSDDVKRFDNVNQQDVYVVAAVLVGRHRLAIGANGEAQELFAHVPPTHPYGSQARKCAAAR